MRPMILAPSILSADFMELGDQIEQSLAGGAEYIHFDVMDGRFVPNISFGIPVLKSVRKKTDAVIDVHLMIADPQRYIDAFADAGADIITFHYEACEDIKGALDQIHARGKKTGVSIKPGTPAEVLLPYLEEIDLILVMSVEPGFGGQKFMPASLDKIRFLRDELKKRDLEADIEVDGGIGAGNAGEIAAAGANVLVAGSAVFGGDIKENARRILAAMQEA